MPSHRDSAVDSRIPVMLKYQAQEYAKVLKRQSPRESQRYKGLKRLSPRESHGYLNSKHKTKPKHYSRIAQIAMASTCRAPCTYPYQIRRRSKVQYDKRHTRRTFADDPYVHEPRKQNSVDMRDNVNAAAQNSKASTRCATT